MKKMRTLSVVFVGLVAAWYLHAVSFGYAGMTIGQIKLGDLCNLQEADSAVLPADLTDAQPVELKSVPESGTFWSLQNFGKQPPLPFSPFPHLPVYILGNGEFVFDDSDVDYNALGRTRTTNASTTLEALDGEGGEPSNGPGPDTKRNFDKFLEYAFWLIDTNDVALYDTNLYNACISFPEDTNTAPTLQIKPYGLNAVIIKASHFDYSVQTNWDFALLICDSVDKPIWKNIDLGGASSTQDGWLIQGIVSRFNVTDPMYLMVENIAPDCSVFFRAIPYGGPQISISGLQPYAVVSNTISFQVEITDLSGATNHQLTVLVNGLEPRYTLGPSNTITIDTRYTPDDFVTLSVTVANFDAIVHNSTNLPMSRKLTFDNTVTVPLVFENETYVYFPGNMSDPDIGTNYFLFGVTPPHYVHATITEPFSGRILRSFSGYNPSYSYVQLSWNFTEADGVTPYTNDEYVVTFTASNNAASGGTTLTITNTIERSRVRPAGWVISNYEEVRPSTNQGWGSWVNSQLQTWWNAVATAYETLYAWQFASQTQYYPWQIGSDRNTPTSPKMPFVLNPSSEASWPQFVRECVTNRGYSISTLWGMAMAG